MQDPMPLGRYTKLPLSEITVRASRSSGPGGQHANVTASRIEAVFDVESSATLSDTHRQRIIAKLGPRVVAIAQDARSQAQNRELALQRLQERLTQALYVAPGRRATRPTRASVARREEGKRIQAERKRQRRRPSSDD